MTDVTPEDVPVEAPETTPEEAAPADSPQPSVFAGARAQEWTCLDQDGAFSGHPTWEEDVERGEFPTCPICGSHSALQVDAAAPV